MEKRARGRLRMKAEEIELAAELPVVAPLRLLEEGEMLAQLLRRGERGAVDALQHLVALVAAPVRAGDAGELEGLQAAGRRHVRPAAEVGEIALGIERHLPLGDALDDLDLVVLADAAEVGDSVGACELAARHREVRTGELLHGRLDAREILGRERAIALEIVVEAALDHRPDRHLRLGEEPLHRVRHQVRGRMTEDVGPFRRVRENRRDDCVGGERSRQVDDGAVDARRDRLIGARGAERPQRLARGGAALHVHVRAARKSDANLRFSHARR